VQIRGVADAVGAAYFAMPDSASIETVIDAAQAASLAGRPVIVDVNIDYSKATRFTKGILRTNFRRMTIGNQFRMVGRAAWRHAVKPDRREHGQ